MGVRFPWPEPMDLSAPLLIRGVVRFEGVLPASHGHRSQVEPCSAITVSRILTPSVNQTDPDILGTWVGVQRVTVGVQKVT